MLKSLSGPPPRFVVFAGVLVGANQTIHEMEVTHVVIGPLAFRQCGSLVDEAVVTGHDFGPLRWKPGILEGLRVERDVVLEPLARLEERRQHQRMTPLASRDK